MKLQCKIAKQVKHNKIKGWKEIAVLCANEFLIQYNLRGKMEWGELKDIGQLNI